MRRALPSACTAPQESITNAATDSLTLRVQAEQIADAYLPNGGRPPVIADADKVQLFLAALSDGNYRETALKLAGIAKQTYYNTLKRAEAGEEAASVFVDAVEKAEALAESEMVQAVRKAGKSPQFWAAAATHLERKHPERWGKRQDDSSGPKVQVIIGATESDVRVNVIAHYQTPDTLNPTDSLCKPALTEGESHTSAPVTVSAPVSTPRRRGTR